MRFSRAILLIWVSFGSLGWSSLSAAATPPIATVVSVAGPVMVRRALQTSNILAQAHKAEPNESLFKGDVVSTGLDGFTKLIFPDDSIVDLGPSSMFKVDRFEGADSERRQAFFTLLYGRVRALVTKAVGKESKFQLRTPDVLMGVRGTEFIVNAPLAFSRGTVGTAASMSTKTEITVLTGLVSMSVPKLNEPPVDISAGMHIATSSFQASMPSATALSAEQLREVRAGATVADNTFDRTVSLDAGAHYEKAPLEASPRALAGEQVAVVRETLSENYESGAFVDPDVFGALDSFRDVPAVRIPGNLQPVNVRLSR